MFSWNIEWFDYHTSLIVALDMWFPPCLSDLNEPWSDSYVTVYEVSNDVGYP